jgi:hypothetical protein
MQLLLLLSAFSIEERSWSARYVAHPSNCTAIVAPRDFVRSAIKEIGVRRSAPELRIPSLSRISDARMPCSKTKSQSDSALLHEIGNVESKSPMRLQYPRRRSNANCAARWHSSAVWEPGVAPEHPAPEFEELWQPVIVSKSKAERNKTGPYGLGVDLEDCTFLAAPITRMFLSQLTCAGCTINPHRRDGSIHSTDAQDRCRRRNQKLVNQIAGKLR